MRKRFLSLFLLPLFLLVGCSESKDNYESQSVVVERSRGDIGNFELLSPGNGFIADSNFTFSWEEASNADYYQLEIANTENFLNDPDEVYVKESNLSSTKFDLNYSLPLKDTTYYWRVTAVNKDHKKTCTAPGDFFYKSIDAGELPIEIEDEQDWSVHKEGSQATVSIDRNNFFGNNKNSLVITFDKEHTSQGISKSDGWIVITKTEDRELYGTDAFYFNFFYSGHDATVLVRVLDYDGEYWHQQVQIANNSKQTILMKYEDFTLRTAGTNINNREFDWQHIRYFEIVFERTFGDGVCVFSNIKAVKFANYKQMFMEHMDFQRDDEASWTFENYEFQKTIIEDGNGITLGYTKATGFNGYGFQNINLYKYFSKGDALRMKIKYTGTSAAAMFYFRVLEEDMDRWQYKLPFADFTKLATPEDPADAEYKILIIPLKAFQRTDYMQGDGAKQFYYVQKFNVGLADNYADGSITIKDLEVVPYSDIVDSRTRVVSNTGLIEDFNNYDLYTEIYYSWDQSVENKDEAMKLDTIHKVNGKNKGVSNVYCGEFDYKADMEQAVYQLYLNSSAASGFNAFSIWLNDASVRPNDPVISYLDEDSVAAEMTIQLTLDTNEWYRYVIPTVYKEWYKYTISFEDFELVNEDALFDEPNPLSSEHIIHIAFGFKYFYYQQGADGKPDTKKPHPTYAIANPVYLDEIYFENAMSTSVTELPGTLKPDLNNSAVVNIDAFEKNIYPDNESLEDYWSDASNGTAATFSEIAISDDVSALGGEQSLSMKYMNSNSVSYVRNTPFNRKVTGKGIAIDVKGDGKAVVYINLNLRCTSTKVIKMRYALTNIPTTWTHYEIGFDYFKDVEGSMKSISLSNAKDIETISFGIVKNTDTSNTSYIYIDNMKMLSNINYWDYSQTAIVAAP